MRTTTRRSIGRGVLWMVCAAVALLWWFAARPTALGGDSGYLVVRGESMTPELEPGDFVVLQRADTYAAGDVIAFRPDESRAVVIHRVVGADADGRSYTTRGDALPVVDPWHPDDGDVAGRMVAHVPRLGRTLLVLRQPLVIGALAGAAAFAMALFADQGRKMSRRGSSV